MLKKDANRRREHEAVRNAVGYYDFTHQLVEVTGNDVVEFMDHIFVNKMASTKVGGAQYSTMLDEEAKIQDDVIIFRLEEKKYWISTLFVEEMLKWLEKHKDNYQVEYEEITDHVSMYAVQGPKSRATLNQLSDKDLDDLNYFNIVSCKIDNFNVQIARAGFTGELGFEVYLHPDYTNRLEELLEEAGKEYGITAIDTDVKLKSLPVEKGFVLMSDIGGLTPYEAIFGWSVDWDSNFIGKEKLKQEKESGSTFRLRGFTITSQDEEVEIEEGTPIFYENHEVGKVTSFTYGYTVEDYIGFALVDKTHVPKNEEVIIESNGNQYTAITHDRVFYDKDNKRVRGD